MMRRMVICLLLAFVVLQASNAQEEAPRKKLSLIPRVGINWATEQLRDAEGKWLDCDARTGFTAGFDVDFEINEPWGMTLGLLYSQEGGNIKNPDYQTTRQHCFTLPVLVHYSPFAGFQLKAGVMVGIGGGMTEKEYYGDDLSQMGRMYFPVGCSYEYKNFMIDARYAFGSRMSVLPYTPSQVFSVTIGYRIPLGTFIDKEPKAGNIILPTTNF